jgi:arylsulfatase A
MRNSTILSFLFLGMVLTGACSKDSNVAFPNIIVILCDDLGYGDLSCFGHPYIQTPNLDRLALEGIKLTSCYSAAPVCSPSRVGLITGRSPNRAGVYDWIPEGRNVREDCRDLVHLRSNEITIPALLKQAGYQTCLVGKWHCNAKFNSPEQAQPSDLGFDWWFGTQNNALPDHENPVNFVRNGQEVGPMQGFSCQLVVKEAIDWLDRADMEKPFYLQVCFHEPHEKVASPLELVEKYEPVSKNHDEAQYFANVANVDSAVGILMDRIVTLEEEGNTLVIFTSDNGPETLNRYATAYRSYGSPGKLRGMKLWTHEAGFRVPGIIYWPGRVEGGIVLDTPVSSLDFLPTFCSLSGVDVADLDLDGMDISALLKSGEVKRTKPLIWCYYNALNDHYVAMREGDWKIMAKLNIDGAKLPSLSNVYEGNEQFVKRAVLEDHLLFRLSADPSETSEVSADYPDVFLRMQELLQDQYAELLENSPVWSRVVAEQ